MPDNITSTLRVSGKSNTRVHLSVGAAKEDNYVNTWHHDDNSGRQLWKFEKIPNTKSDYTLMILKGRPTDSRRYLSVPESC